MKRIIFCFLIASLGCSSCQYQPQNKEPEKPKYKLTEIWVNYIKENKDVFNNEITRKKAAENIQMSIIDSIKNDISILSSIPLKYVTSMQSGKNYIVKFSLSNYNSMNIKFKTENPFAYYEIAFDIFTIADESFVEKLVDGNFYYINSCNFDGSVNNKIILPSGKTFYQNPYLSKDHSTYSLNLGGFYATDVELK